MRLIHAKLQMLNPTRPEVERLDVNALANSCAVHHCIPEHVALPLQLRELERREVLLGAIPMEDTDLVLQPQLPQLSVNPENPNLPLSVAKGMPN